MPWIAGAVAGGAALNYISAGNAADKQADAASKAIDATTRGNAQARTDLAPYREAGDAALSRLRSLLGIGAAVDQSDPRYLKIYDDTVNGFNDLHQSKFGISIWDPARGYGGQLPQHDSGWPPVLKRSDGDQPATAKVHAG
jgi:hypothetical protein